MMGGLADATVRDPMREGREASSYRLRPATNHFIDNMHHTCLAGWNSAWGGGVMTDEGG